MEGGPNAARGPAKDAGDELLRRCSRGDDSALTDLIRLYGERIHGLALRMLGDPALAEEAAALALVKVWTGARSWRGEARAGTWIYRVAVRAALDLKRGEDRWRRRRESSSPRSLPDRRPGPAALAAAEEERERRSARVREALAGLEELDRALVHLYYYEDRSLGEIEEILLVPRANLKMRLARAREKLRALLGGDDGSI